MKLISPFFEGQHTEARQIVYLGETTFPGRTACSLPSMHLNHRNFMNQTLFSSNSNCKFLKVIVLLVRLYSLKIRYKSPFQESLRVSEEHLAAARRQQKVATSSLHELENKNSTLQADNKRLSSDVSY